MKKSGGGNISRSVHPTIISPTAKQHRMQDVLTKYQKNFQ